MMTVRGILPDVCSFWHLRGHATDSASFTSCKVIYYTKPGYICSSAEADVVLKCVLYRDSMLKVEIRSVMKPGLCSSWHCCMLQVNGPSVYRSYLAAAQRVGLSDGASSYWELHIKEDERHGRQMVEDVAVPLIEQ